MSNKKKNQTEQQAAQPEYVADLLKNGTTTLTAPTRDELAEMVNEIPADVRIGTGAVGQNRDTGLFSIRIDIIKSD
jgi:hypothetical protein